MPIRYTDNSPATAIFEGNCAPEEADALLEWLRRTPAPAADLRAVGEPHTALVQLLLAARVQMIAPPNDPVFAACLDAHLKRAGEAEPLPASCASHRRVRRGARKSTGQNSLPQTARVPS